MNDSNVALATSAVTFVSSYILMLLIKPRWFHVELENGKRVVATEKITLYSVLFGLLGGLASVAIGGMARARRASMQKLGFRFGSLRPHHIATAASVAAAFTGLASFLILHRTKPSHVMDKSNPQEVEPVRVLGLSTLYAIISFLFVFVYFEVFDLQA